jgi:hypothetical protein
MASVLDLAKCCSAVYETAPNVPGLNLISRYSHPRDGFFAALFEKKTTLFLPFAVPMICATMFQVTPRSLPVLCLPNTNLPVFHST